MYVDNESIKVFERMHERDRLKERLHHIDEDEPDTDIFSAHVAEHGMQSFIVIAVVIAAVWLALAYIFAI